MNKYLITADFHILEKRISEIKSRVFVPIISKLTEDKDIKGICILGDIFDYDQPNDKEIDLFIDFIHAIPLDKIIYILSGNHDIDKTNNAISWVDKLRGGIRYSKEEINIKIADKNIRMLHKDVAESKVGPNDRIFNQHQSFKEIEGDIILLGHIHSPEVLSLGGTFHPWNYELEYLAGFFDGEGSITQHTSKVQNKLFSIQITQKNKLCVENVLKLIQKYEPNIKGSIHEQTGAYDVVFSTRQALTFLNLIYPYINHPDRISKILKYIKDANDTFKLSSTEMYTLKENVGTITWPYLAGFFDAEGHIRAHRCSSLAEKEYKVPRVVIVQKNKELIVKIHKFLLSHNVNSHIQHQEEFYKINLTTHAAEKFIQYIYPFVLEKRNQIDQVSKAITIPSNYNLTSSLVLHPGSPYYINFGERNDTKGFFIVDFTNSSYEFVKLNPIPMIQIDVADTDIADLQDKVNKIDGVTKLKLNFKLQSASLEATSQIQSVIKYCTKMFYEFKWDVEVKPTQHMLPDKIQTQDKSVSTLLDKFCQEEKVDKEIHELLKSML
jgi:DNA repair exonuclease SbcCD nuclease subunit